MNERHPHHLQSVLVPSQWSWERVKSKLQLIMGLLSRQTTLALLLIAVPVLYELYCPQSWTRGASHVAELGRRWEDLIKKPQHPPRRIAVGVNSNLDLIVSATALFQALDLTPLPLADHHVLTSLSDLQEVVAYSMQHCAGIERFFNDKQVFQQTVEAAKTVPHTYHIGGNAALMAEKIQQTEPEAQVMLAGPIGTKLRELLHPRMLTPSHGQQQQQEEVHMILEYPKGEQWGAATSSCANRVIYSHDVSNSRMVALESFHRSLRSFHPDLVVFSGTHILEGQPETFWMERLKDIQGLLESMPADIPVHLELATVGDMKFLGHVASSLFPRITSLGLNEQELVSVAKAMEAEFDFNKIPPKPGIEDVSDLLHWFVQTFVARKDSRLSRVHFHSLTFHVITSLKEGPWRNSHIAVLAGTRTAGLQACDMETFHSTRFDLRIPMNFTLSHSDPDLSASEVRFAPERPTVSWVREGWEYFMSPVLVCKEPLKTVGLGDAISAMGLMYSEFQRHPSS